jgi:hypothetical protein
MNDATPVGVIERVQHVTGDSQSLRDSQRGRSIQALPQGRPVDVAHDIVDQPLPFAGVDDACDVWMVQLRGDLDLAKEPVGSDTYQQLRVENLERKVVSACISREKDPSVSAFAILPLDLVSAGKGLAHQRQHVAPDGRSWNEGI